MKTKALPRALQKPPRKARRHFVEAPRGRTTLIVKLIKIGNSRGVRLPKAIIEQAGLERGFDLTVRNGAVVLTPVRQPRAGWAESIKAAVAKHGHDVDEEFLDLPNEFPEKEWTWPQSDSTSTSSRSTRRSARK